MGALKNYLFWGWFYLFLAWLSGGSTYFRWFELLASEKKMEKEHEKKMEKEHEKGKGKNKGKEKGERQRQARPGKARQGHVNRT